MSYYIKVDGVEPGMFSSEREVSFTLDDGRKVTALVDSKDLDSNYLRVSLVDRTNEKALVDLPREPFSGSGRLFVPTAMLVQR